MEPTREILWNIHAGINMPIVYALLVVATMIASLGVYRHYEFWRSGKPNLDSSVPFLARLNKLIAWGAFQRGVVRDPSPGIMHTLIYFGFLILLLTTTVVAIDYDLGIRIYRGDFYLILTVLSDLFGLGLLFGCGLAAHRRYLVKSDRVHNRFADSLMLSSLALMIAQGFVLEGLRIHVTHDPWAMYSPVGLLVAKFFWALSPDAATDIHFATWWFHTATVMTFIGLLPYTKFFHIVASSINLFFSPSDRPRGALQYPGDLEKLMESDSDFSMGLGTIKDYSWRQLLDLDACTSCGRCQDNCPAYLSGKPLSPKWLILDTRNHALSLHSQGKLTESDLPSGLLSTDSFLSEKLYLASSGFDKEAPGGYESGGAFRATNQAVQNSTKSLGVKVDDRIAGDVLDQNVFWSCTTCMACVEACPVGINHLDQIIGNRRNMVLMQGEIPTEAQKALRTLESVGNPYGPADQRTKWIEGLNVPIIQPGESVDYLYWVGCVSAYDPRKQKIARSLVTLMNQAGLNFGILGNMEGCSGDPARRLGEENLFQTMAKSNIEILKSVSFKVLVANCPHCFNTIKNEYPQFGNLSDGAKPEIIHHSVLLKRLLDENKLTVQSKDGLQQLDVTFHDPCYLGRHNNEYEAPRSDLRSIKSLNIIEMERNREKGFCCGAGGGHFWMDLKQGERVNVLRVDQAAETGATKVATACPFCMQMMEDGVKLTNRENNLEVKDIAEFLVENTRA